MSKNWYDTIQEDHEILSLMGADLTILEKDISTHPAIQSLVHKIMADTYAVNYADWQNSTPYSQSYYRYKSDRMTEVIDIIGKALFFSLLRRNPEFLGVVAKYLLKIASNEFMDLRKAANMPKPDDNLHQLADNKDYDYWSELSEDGSIMFVMFDHPEFNDGVLEEIYVDDFDSALKEADSIVKDLYSGKIPLSKYGVKGKIKHTSDSNSDEFRIHHFNTSISSGSSLKSIISSITA